MLAVKLICVGKMRERFYIDAFEEYSKRLRAYCKLELTELAEQRLSDSPSAREIENALSREAAEIIKNIPPDAYTVAMCVEGRMLKSEGVAELIAAREGSGKPRLCLIIGGSFGLDESVKARADMRLSMSAMTFPHHLARVMALEQLYRAESIQAGTKYHK